MARSSAHPLLGVHDQALAVVVLFRGRRPFADEDVLLTQHLERSARGALERSELFEGERRARRFSQELARVGGLLTASLNPIVVLEEVARGARAPRSRCRSHPAARARRARGASRERRGHRAARGHTCELVHGNLRRRRPVPCACRLPRCRAAAAPGAGRSPARAGDRRVRGGSARRARGGLYGVLGVYSNARRTWRDDEVQTLSALAATASASAANAELYQRVAEEKERKRCDPGQHRRRHRRRRPGRADRPLE